MIDYGFMTREEERIKAEQDWDDTYNEALQGKPVQHCLRRLDDLLEVKTVPHAVNVKVVDSPLKTQGDGKDHYSSLSIQPVVYIEKNGLSFLEGCIVKRVSRYKSKFNGKEALKDLNKIKHEVDLLIEIHFKGLSNE